MSIRYETFALFTMLVLSGAAEASVVWDFDGTANPSGANLQPEIEHTLGHAIHDGLFQAKYRDKLKFCIMWENGCAEGVKDVDDLLDNLLPFWIENYFTHPSYLKLGDMPLLFVWQPRRLLPQLRRSRGHARRS